MDMSTFVRRHLESTAETLFSWTLLHHGVFQHDCIILTPSSFWAIVRMLYTCLSKTVSYMVCSTKVLCPQNLFSRKSQRYKGRMSRCVDIRHMCFWHRHILWLLLTKNHDILQWCKQNKHFRRITGNRLNSLRYMSWRRN